MHLRYARNILPIWITCSRNNLRKPSQQVIIVEKEAVQYYVNIIISTTNLKILNIILEILFFVYNIKQIKLFECKIKH